MVHPFLRDARNSSDHRVQVDAASWFVLVDGPRLTIRPPLPHPSEKDVPGIRTKAEIQAAFHFLGEGDHAAWSILHPAEETDVFSACSLVESVSHE